MFLQKSMGAVSVHKPTGIGSLDLRPPHVFPRKRPQILLSGSLSAMLDVKIPFDAFIVKYACRMHSIHVRTAAQRSLWAHCGGRRDGPSPPRPQPRTVRSSSPPYRLLHPMHYVNRHLL